MTHTAGVKLNRFGTGGSNGLSVHIRVDICLHHTNLQIILQGGDQAGQRSGFDAAGRGPEIQQVNAFLFQLLTQLIGLGIVVREYTLLNFQNSYLFQKHRFFLVIPA